MLEERNGGGGGIVGCVDVIESLVLGGSERPTLLREDDEAVADELDALSI